MSEVSTVSSVGQNVDVDPGRVARGRPMEVVGGRLTGLYGSRGPWHRPSF
ncbi:hypothetical protein ACWCXX_39830 [Streptomyces sp. NPDC001732]